MTSIPKHVTQWWATPEDAAVHIERMTTAVVAQTGRADWADAIDEVHSINGASTEGCWVYLDNFSDDPSAVHDAPDSVTIMYADHPSIFI